MTTPSDFSFQKCNWDDLTKAPPEKVEDAMRIIRDVATVLENTRGEKGLIEILVLDMRDSGRPFVVIEDQNFQKTSPWIEVSDSKRAKGDKYHRAGVVEFLAEFSRAGILKRVDRSFNSNDRAIMFTPFALEDLRYAGFGDAAKKAEDKKLPDYFFAGTITAQLVREFEKRLNAYWTNRDPIGSCPNLSGNEKLYLIRYAQAGGLKPA